MYESKIACVVTYFNLWSYRESQTVFYVVPYVMNMKISVAVAV